MMNNVKTKPDTLLDRPVGNGWFNGIRGKFYGNNILVLITFALLIAIYAAASIVFRKEHFGSLNGIFSMINSYPHLVVIAAGMTMVLISGNIDISVGGQCAMYCMMLAYFMQSNGHNVNAYVMILIVLITGMVFGLVQGVLVAYFKVQPFIVTLVGMFFARGMVAMISTDPIAITNPDFRALQQIKLTLPFGGYTDAGGQYQTPFIFLYSILALLTVLVVYAVMTWSTFGRSVYAVGGSQQSAVLMGLKPKRVTLIVFIFQGLLTAFGSTLFCLQAPGGSVEKVMGFEMNAIAAAVIGGALLTGGVGNILGSLAGTLMQTMIFKAVVPLKLSDGWGAILTAIMMAIFLAMQAVLNLRRRKHE